MRLVSVIIPTRNRAHLLHRTLESVLKQSTENLEAIVVDDGSTDGSGAVAAAMDPRVSVLRNPERAGVSVARNRGIASARGEWVAFCDDDDLWAPNKLQEQLTAADAAGANWVYAGDVNVDDQLRVLSGGPPPDPAAVMTQLPRHNPLASGGSNVMVRSNILAEVGGFDPALRRTEDWDLWIRIAQKGPPAYVRKPLVAYRFHSGNVVWDPREMVDEARRLAARYGIPVDLLSMHRRAAWAALRSGRRLTAARHYARAVAGGDLRSVGRAAIALVHPAVGSERLFGFLGRDSDWIAEAEGWIETFATDAHRERRSR
ncbi:MAG TPA: glycosyltransferase family A protein [Vicinamibacterales bacterium]|nr:glycosyltransferase family A protein [Vicinamibacterales bacterium]